MKFSTVAPAKVSAEQAGMNRLMVTVSRLTGAEAIGSRPVGSEGDPLATAHSGATAATIIIRATPTSW